MNRIYKTVWNEQTRTFVAVSELTRARGKRSGASVACGGGAGWLGTRLALGVAALVGAGMMSVSLPAFAEIVLQDSTSPIEVDGNGIVFSNGAGSIQFTNGGTITGLSNGSVAAGSTQAVNGGQLYTVQQNLTSAVTAAQSTAGQALTQANKGWNIKAGSEGGSGGNVQPGDTVTVAGGQNIDVTRSGTTLTVKTKDDINAATLASTGNTTVGGALNVNGATVLHNGVTVTGASQFNGPVTVSGQTTLNGGLNVAGNKITNVGDGTIAAGSTDAVTGGQLHDLQENLYESGTGIKYFHANSTQADSVAAGQDAIAIGPQSVANADASMAAGQGAVVGENADGAIAQGQGATVAQNAEAAIAIGQGAQVGTAGVAALAMGRDAQSNGAGSVAIGDGAIVESEFVSNATALGTGASVTGAYSNNAMALGTDAVASAVGAAALGQSAAASGANALAGGTGASAEGASSVALGNNSRAGAGGTVSLGNGATTATQNSIAIGTNAGVGTVDVPVNPGFDKTSHIAIGTEAGQNVSGNQTTAIGYGAGSNITGDYTVSVGNEAGANLKGDHNISIGYLANQRAAATSVEHSVAIGGMSAAGTGSVAVGESAQANSEYAMALGFNARATSDGGVALGSGANAAGDSVALGSSSQAVASTGVGYLTGTNASQNPISVVSVGGGGGGTAATRRITNVADGAAATDAVNVSQLAASQQNLATILGQGTIVDGKVTEFKVGTQTYSSVAQALTELGNGGTGTVINDVGAVLYDGGSNSTVATLAGAGGTTVKNVKAGVDDTDAVNVAQLNKTVDDNKAHYYSVNSELSANYNNSGATGTESMAIGPSASASGANSVAVGHTAVVTGSNGTALGSSVQSLANNATVIGHGSIAYDESTVAIGEQAKSRGENSIVIGTRAEADAKEGSATVNNAIVIGTDADVTADNGVAIGEQSVSSATKAMAFGYEAAARGTSSTAIGANATSSGVNAIATGTGATSSGSNAQASGTGAVSSGADSIATGTGAVAYASNGIALGKGAVSGVATPDPDKVADNTDTIAIGTRASATAKNSVAIGVDSNTQSSYASTTARYSNVVHDDAASGVVSVGNHGGQGGANSIERRITNVAGGMYDTDAVNVKQLRAVRDTGWSYSGNSGSTTQTMGSDVKIVGGATTAVTSSQNVKTVVTPGTSTVDANGDVVYQNGKIEIQFAETPSFQGADMGGKKITSVAAGDVTNTSTDAVNGSQLKQVKDTAEKGWNLTANGVGSSNVAPGGAVDLANDDGNIAITKSGNNVKFNLADDVNVNNNLTVGGNSSVAGNMSVTGNTNLNGDLAVTGASNLTGGATISNQLVVNPNTLVNMGGNKVTNVAAGEVSSTSTDAINGSQLHDVANRPITFQGNAGSTPRKLGETQVIRGSLDNGAAASSSNIRTTVNGAGEMEILLANNLTADSLTINNGGPVINAGGINMGGKKITNLAEGTDGTDAVNLDQLNRVDETANKGWNLTASGANASNVKPGDTVDLASAADNNIVVSKDASNNVKFGLADDVNVKNDLTVGGDSSVTGNMAIGGNTTMAGDLAVTGTSNLTGGATIGNQLVVNPNTLVDMGGNKVTNVAAGEVSSTSTDAINGSQLHDVANRPITFQGDTGDVARKLGETQIIHGSLAASDAASSSNIRTQVNAAGDMEILLANNLTADSLTINNGGPVLNAGGINMGGKKITNLAEGTDGTDAVNVDQLNRVDETANKGWNLTASGANASNVKPGDTVDLASAADNNIVVSKDASNSVKFGLADDVKVKNDLAVGGNTTMAGDLAVTGTSNLTGGAIISNQLIVNPNTLVNMGGNKVTNVAAGEVSSTSTDAINGSQLHDVANSPITFQGNTGSTPRKLGETQIIHGSLAASDAASSSNIRTQVNAAGDMEILLANNLTADSLTINNGGPVINAGGINMGGKKITNLAEGTDGTDAVNVDQLNRVDETANKGWNLTASGANASNVKPGDTVDLASAADNNIVVSKDASNNVKFGLADDVNVKNDLTVGGDSSVAGNMSVAGDTALAGDVAVGGNTTMAGDLAVTGASTLTGGATIGNQLVVNPNTLVNMGGNKVTNVAAGEVSSTSTDAINGSQLHDVANRPITFQGNTGDVARKLGETQIIRGSLAASDAASSSNIRTQVNAAGDMEILLANNLTADSLTINNGGPVLNAGGINMGGKKITNLAEGTDGTDAVNVDQLNRVDETANKGWNLTASGANASNVKPGDTVDLASAADNNIVVSKDASNSVKFGLADDVKVKNDLTVGGNSSVTGNMAIGGNTTMAGDLAVTGTSNLTGGAIISNQLIVNPNTLVNMGGNKVTNVAAGEVSSTSTDAINGSQLHDVANSPITFQGNAGSTPRKLGETQVIRGSLDNGAAASSSNIRTTVNGAGEMEILLANNLTADSLTINNGGPVLNAGGINMGGKKITNLAEGTDGTDAVNVDQLNRVDETANKGWNLTASGANASNVKPGDTVDLASAADNNIVVSKDASNNVKFGLADDVNVKNDLTVGGNTTMAGDLAVAGDSNLAGDLTVAGMSNLTGGATISNQLIVNPNTLVDMGGNKVTNVAAGEVSSTSTDAINGSQLHDVANRPITFQGNTGDVARKLGETQIIRGSLAASDAASSSNIRTQVNAAGDMEILLANNLTADSLTINNGGPVLNAGGINMGGKKITNLAEGTDGTDAVNLNQLNKVDETANKGWNLTASGANASNVKPGDTVDLASAADNNIVVSKDASNSVKFGLADDVKVKNDLTVGGNSSVTGNMAIGGNTTMAGDLAVTGTSNLTGGAIISNQLVVNPNTLVNMGGNKVTNVAAGEVSSTSTDAINGSQLYDVANSPITFQGNAGSTPRKLGETQVIRGSLDNGAAASSSNIRTTVNGAGEMEILLANNLTADSLTINNGGPVINVSGIDMKSLQISNLAEGTKGTDAVNLDQLNRVSEVANKGWNLTANGADSSNVAPGATVDLANDDGNIDITKSGNEVKFNLAKDIAVDSVTTGNTVMNTDGITIQGGPAGNIVLNNTGLTAGTVEISSLTGINAGGFRITNVAAGINDTDAVNVSQLKDVQNNVDNLSDRAVKYDGNVGDPKNKVTLEGDVSTDGGRTGGTTVTNVARGEISADSTDAVNGSQIHDMGNSIADGMGGNSTFVDGKLVTELNVGGNTYNNVNDALNGVQTDIDNVSNVANKGWNIQTNGDTASKVGPGDTVQFINGDNIEITRDGTNVTVGMAKDIKVDSVTAGKVSTKEVVIENGPTINEQGVDMNGKQITNLADGKNASDAVNLGQLNKVAGNVANSINRLDSKVNRNDNRASAGVAAAMATAGLPQAYLPGKSMFSLAGGTWRGESGYAMGLSTVSDNGKWVIKGTASGSSRGDYGGSVGVGYQW